MEFMFGNGARKVLWLSRIDLSDSSISTEFWVQQIDLISEVSTVNECISSFDSMSTRETSPFAYATPRIFSSFLQAIDLTARPSSGAGIFIGLSHLNLLIKTSPEIQEKFAMKVQYVRLSAKVPHVPVSVANASKSIFWLHSMSSTQFGLFLFPISFMDDRFIFVLNWFEYEYL